jgi:hypothetical protein
MATQGTSNLVVVDGMPSVEKLWNGRFRLEFFCTPSNKNEGWYGDNIAKWLPEFGTLQGTDFTGEGWAALDGEVYPNMCLVEAEAPYIPPSESHLVKLVYETLTTEWVQEKDDTVTYSENGLERVSRLSVALPDTAYTSVVGTTTVDSDGTTLYLAAREIDETDAKWTLSETWAEAGKLSESDPVTGPNRIRQKTVVWQGVEGAAPTGYVGASRKTDNVEGFPTITVTYYFSSDLSQEFPAYTTTVPFTMPGTVDFATSNLASGTRNKMLELSPPVSTLCEAFIVDSYTTDPSLVDINAAYQPNYWTRVIIEGIGLNYYPFSSTSTYVNHIALSSGTSSTGPLVGTEFIQGNRLFGGTTGYIRIDGPTYDPAGKTIIINDNADPIFTLLDGTQYYKRTVTTINVPARNS